MEVMRSEDGGDEVRGQRMGDDPDSRVLNDLEFIEEFDGKA